MPFGQRLRTFCRLGLGAIKAAVAFVQAAGSAPSVTQTPTTLMVDVRAISV